MNNTYNYIIFNGYDGFNMSPYNDEGYYSICMKDLWAFDNIRITNSPSDQFSIFLRICYKLFLKMHIPLPRFLFPFFTDLTFKEQKPLCFIIVGYAWPMSYYIWLKKKYPEAIFVRFTRDLISTQQEFIDSLKATNVIDYWITYDEEEAKKYGMIYYPEIESKIDIQGKPEVLYDVFFAGRAKKRLPKIIEIYDKLESAGLNCFFYIMSASKKEIKERKGIVYSNKYLTYKKMLEYSMQSKCLLEVNQEGAIGYTSRFIEAVMYNKLLLTDNNSILNTSFYKDRFMQCFKSSDDIDVDFLKRNIEVDYNYNNEFSPVNFIGFVENLIQNREKCEKMF